MMSELFQSLPNNVRKKLKIQQKWNIRPTRRLFSRLPY